MDVMAGVLEAQRLETEILMKERVAHAEEK